MPNCIGMRVCTLCGRLVDGVEVVEYDRKLVEACSVCVAIVRSAAIGHVDHPFEDIDSTADELGLSNIEFRTYAHTLLATPTDWLIHICAQQMRRPNHPRVLLGVGDALIRQGQWRDGWRLMLWRWTFARDQYREFQGPPYCDVPLWSGQPLQGKRIWLYCEQGYGDGLQFVRFAGLLADAGAEVTAIAPLDIAALIGTVPGISHVVKGPPATVEGDYRSSVMDLPGYLGITPENVPTRPYVSVPPGADVPLPERDGQLKVGLVWAGNTDDPMMARRSMPLHTLLPLMNLPGIAWYSIQHGPRGTDDLITCGLTDIVEDVGGRLQNWSETAAVVQQMDLILSIDTSVAHLAGAMGKPVWLLLEPFACWRWGTDEHKTVWYPTMRLFRQTKAGGWPGLIERVKAELIKGTARCTSIELSEGAESAMSILIVYADGACRGNPGPMAVGASIQTAEGVELSTVSTLLGQGTNNLAEYSAAIAGIRKAREHGTDTVELRMDSQLVVKQLTGEFVIRKEELRPLREELLELLTTYDHWTVAHVRRELNQRADELANLAYSC